VAVNSKLPFTRNPFRGKCRDAAGLLVNHLLLALFGDADRGARRLTSCRFDQRPVTPGHLLVIPLRHVTDFFALAVAERTAMFSMADRAKAMLDQRFEPDGYDLGVNIGVAAGRTIAHVHLHPIPRYRGDVANPRGEVRGVIPARQNY
jgi:diadenosine tetraphosphate (Ap4A) HIT family hydrolase